MEKNHSSRIWRAAEVTFVEIVFMSCLAHIRRRFFEHHKIAKAAVKKEPKQTAALKHSWQILSLMSQLYRIESELRKSGAGPRLRQAIRSSQSRPIVKRLKAIFKILMARYRPSHLLGEALKYALGQWTRFENYLENGLLEIDNNLVENAVRPTKLGMKNWLFFGSKEAGRRSPQRPAPKNILSRPCQGGRVGTAYHPLGPR